MSRNQLQTDAYKLIKIIENIKSKQEINNDRMKLRFDNGIKKAEEVARMEDAMMGYIKGFKWQLIQNNLSNELVMRLCKILKNF